MQKRSVGSDQWTDYACSDADFVYNPVANFKDYEFYTGESMNPDGMVVLLNYREDGTTPYLTLCALIFSI